MNNLGIQYISANKNNGQPKKNKMHKHEKWDDIWEMP